MALTHQQSAIARITDAVLERRAGKWWWTGFIISGLLTLMLAVTIGYLLKEGPGIWGLNIPVAWGTAIISFVWWIGIGQAGTFISAICLIMHQKWRGSINRFAETMTLFSVICACLMPLLHLGRPERFYWLIPYPNTMELWPQFRSPLVWDGWGCGTYGYISLVFWYMSLIPDCATMRDRAKTRLRRIVFGMLSLGWRGSAAHWHRHQLAYVLMAGMATATVISVHSIVGLDFAAGDPPGWHNEVYPPYFVAGAIYSGIAIALVIAVPLRKYYHFEDMITDDHLEKCAKVILLTGLITDYGYFCELFFIPYGGGNAEQNLLHDRLTGAYAPIYLLTLFLNVVLLQTLWVKKWRRNPTWLFIIGVEVLFAMWIERFIIVVTPLHRNYMPADWALFMPTVWDYALLVGSLGLFAFLMFGFVRLLPSITIFEVTEQMTDEKEPMRHGSVLEEVRVDGEKVWGLVAEFPTQASVKDAAGHLHALGYRRADAYSPFPIDGLAKEFGHGRGGVAKAAFVFGFLGAGAGYFMQYAATNIDLPWLVAGMEKNSWLAFMQITFEWGIIGGVTAAFLAMLISSGLPRPHHPLFGVPGFEHSTQDRFFISIEAKDKEFDRERTRMLLAELGGLRVAEVPA